MPQLPITDTMRSTDAVPPRHPDEASAISAAVERAAEALECEFGAFVASGSVVSSVGFAAGAVPEEALVRVAQGGGRELTLPSGAVIAMIGATLEDPQPGQIMLARAHGDPFGPEEIILLRGMARILGMALTMMSTVKSLRERQSLLERSAAIQRAITLRAPLPEVLDLIVEGASELLGDEVVGLRMVDPDDPTRMQTVAQKGVPDDLFDGAEEALVGEGVGGRAIAEGRLVVGENYSATPRALSEFVAMGLQAAMAAPIHDKGLVTGSLTVASIVPGRKYSQSEQEMLVAFAQHASLALLDARSVDDLLRQALHDPLTSLANRTLFLDRLEHALARTEREGTAVAVLFLDLDRFKGVNDSLGHATGDALLVQVGERLQRLMRATDTVARFGGDEFAVLVEDVTDQSSVARLAAKVNDSLRQTFVVDGDEILLTGSIGIALAHRRNDDPLRDADHAMYRAKSGGKDRYEFFEQGMRAALLERLELEVDLKKAVDRDEFVLHYQPIVELATGRIVGVEALIRWLHAERGLLLPATFIPLAEETGAIFAIGRWVLREACLRAAKWQPDRTDGARPYVSVNLAAVQLQQPVLVSEIAETLAETGLEPSRLVVEVTEKSLAADRRAIQRLRALKELGVRLAVDDFGTGYSSLHHLERLPLDTLKIPKSFIDTLDDESAPGALARAVLDLGRTFDLQVVAEGVERADQLACLRRLGCLLGQGALFAAAQEIGPIEQLLSDPAASLLGPAAEGGPVPGVAVASAA